MRRVGLNVKPLARCVGIWHRAIMSKESDQRQKERAERLRAALRNNLRRRKAAGNSRMDTAVDDPKSQD